MPEPSTVSARHRPSPYLVSLAVAPAMLVGGITPSPQSDRQDQVRSSPFRPGARAVSGIGATLDSYLAVARLRVSGFIAADEPQDDAIIFSLARRNRRRHTGRVTAVARRIRMAETYSDIDHLL